MSCSPSAETRSERDLRDAAGAVCYEIQMMCIAAAGCSSIALFSDAVQFAFLESFLIHYRNMRDFLYPADAGPDDIIAAHFVAPGSWTYKRKDWQEISDLETERLNKALAHLSYERLSYMRANKMKWKTGAMLKAMRQQFQDFSARVPCGRKSWFAEGRGRSNGTISSGDCEKTRSQSWYMHASPQRGQRNATPRLTSASRSGSRVL